MPWSKHWRKVNQSKWRRVRAYAIRRDKACRRCGATQNLEADHIRPLHKGGKPYELSNVQTLCRTCHRRRTGKQGAAARKALLDRTRERRVWEGMSNERAGFYRMLESDFEGV